LRKVLSFLFAVAFVCATAWAQDTTTIVGTVLDSSGAVMPGPKVRVTRAAFAGWSQMPRETTALPEYLLVIIRLLPRLRAFRNLCRGALCFP
jgi:hypothetical protein